MYTISGMGVSAAQTELICCWPVNHHIQVVKLLLAGKQNAADNYLRCNRGPHMDMHVTCICVQPFKPLVQPIGT